MLFVSFLSNIPWVTLVKLAQYIRDLFPHKEFVGPISSSSNFKGTRDLYKSSRCIHPSCIVIIITFRRGDLVGPPPPPYMSLVLRLEQDLDRCSVRAGGQREGSLLQRAGGQRGGSLREQAGWPRIPTPADDHPIFICQSHLVISYFNFECSWENVTSFVLI